MHTRFSRSLETYKATNIKFFWTKMEMQTLQTFGNQKCFKFNFVLGDHMQ